MKKKYKEIKNGERKRKEKEKKRLPVLTQQLQVLLYFTPSLRLQYKQYLFTKGFVTKTRYKMHTKVKPNLLCYRLTIEGVV